jgi:hypothetical protein
MIDSTQSVAPLNPFNLQDRATTARRSESTDDFSRQLSEALADSLRRMGVTPGQINISMGASGGSDGARQIIVTLGSATETSAAATAGTSNAVDTAATPAEVTSNDMPSSAGKTTASGAPLIQLNSTPWRNEYGYTGPAAYNPYFASPDNPLVEGYVEGYRNWFLDAQILGGQQGPIPANRLYFATEEGANEVLRLVRNFVPEAELVEDPWGGGPFSTSRPMYSVRLPGNKLLNAGLLLNAYYNGGSGVSSSSDLYLARELALASA